MQAWCRRKSIFEAAFTAPSNDITVFSPIDNFVNALSNRNNILSAYDNIYSIYGKRSNAQPHKWRTSSPNKYLRGEYRLRESRHPPNQIFRRFFIFFIYKFHVVKLFKNIFTKFQNSRFRTHCAVKPDAQLCCAPRPADPLATVPIFRVKFM